MRTPFPNVKNASLLALFLAAGLTACAPRYDAKSAPMRTGYTCCNLHFEDDWISDGNYGEHPFIAAGTPAKIYGLSGDRAYVEIGGRPVRLGHDYGRKQETLQQWVDKLIVTKDPKVRLASFPPDVREAIRIGKVLEGMTKEQVIMAVGYPMTSETASLNSPVWNYWLSSFDQYQVIWDKEGKARVSADPGVKARAVYTPVR